MQKRQPFESKIVRLLLLASLPLLFLLLWVMIYAGISVWLILLTSVIASLIIFYCGYTVNQKLQYQFRSMDNLLEALIQGDYSLLARTGQNQGALDQLLSSINALAQRLSSQRWESVESQWLSRTIIEHIDVAIIALNPHNHISFFNPAASQLLQIDAAISHPQLLQQLAFAHPLKSGDHQTVELSLGHKQGRFNVHVEEFRHKGEQHKLLFITDIRTLLRNEERKAWQNLVRVISHEINNSLSPIASISQTLKRIIERDSKTPENITDLQQGLTIIAERAKGLSQFIDSYKQLAKFPEPKIQLTPFRQLIERIILLFNNNAIEIITQTDIDLLIDPIQIEQALINLLKNAVEATAPATDTTISISWEINNTIFKLAICDQGSGIGNSDNLFVPFYSTKKQGAGIGLLICRQIIEAHNGRIELRNRQDGKGCCAIIELPVIEF